MQQNATSTLRYKLLASVFFASTLLTLGGCTYTKNLSYSIMDRERTVPDTGMTPLTARRAPVLNPGGALFKANDDLESQKIVSENPYLNEGIKSVDKDAKRGDYAGEAAAAPMVAMNTNQQGNWSGNVFNKDGVTQSGRKMPSENMQMMQQPPTMLTAPVAPIASMDPLPPLAPMPPVPIAAAPASMTPEQVAMNAPAPLPPISVPEKNAVGSDGFPVLSATPPSPAPLPPSRTYDAQMKNMIAERELAENMRREMMQNPEQATPGQAIAMAEPGNTPLPTMQAAQPPVTTPKPDPEFSGWLKKMFDEEDRSNNSAQPRKLVQAENTNNPTSSQAESPLPWGAPPAPVLPEQHAALEPIQLRPPSGIEQPMEPIELTPPAPPVAGESYPNIMSGEPVEPIMLQPPVWRADRPERFLADNRYAARRSGIRSTVVR